MENELTVKKLKAILEAYPESLPVEFYSFDTSEVYAFDTIQVYAYQDGKEVLDIGLIKEGK